jgi:GAF domain-containing protein
MNVWHTMQRKLLSRLGKLQQADPHRTAVHIVRSHHRIRPLRHGLQSWQLIGVSIDLFQQTCFGGWILAEKRNSEAQSCGDGFVPSEYENQPLGHHLLRIKRLLGIPARTSPAL